MISSFRLMSRMIWLHFLCFVVKDTTFASERNLKGDINNNNNDGQESTTCPCFNQKDFNKEVDQVINLTYDYYSGSCQEKQFGSNNEITDNGISFRDIDKDGDGRPRAIGFSAQVDKKVDGWSQCTDSDMVFLISQEEAKDCLSIVTTGCQILKDKVCPCFNFEKLQDPTIGIDPVRSCRRHDGIRTHSRRRRRTLKKSSKSSKKRSKSSKKGSKSSKKSSKSYKKSLKKSYKSYKKSSKGNSKKETWGLFLMNSEDDALPLYGIEKDTKGNNMCIGNAEVSENNLNADQYDHCTKLLERRCTN